MPTELPIGQKWLIDKMAAVPLAIGDEGGFCFAIALIFTMTYLEGRVSEFQALLEEIYKLPIDSLSNNFSCLSAEVEQLLRAGQEAEARRILGKALLIKRLFETIQIFQNPEKHSEYFLLGIPITSLINNGRLLVTLKHFYFSEMQTPPSFLGVAIGTYDENDLIQFLSLLEDTLGVVKKIKWI